MSIIGCQIHWYVEPVMEKCRAVIDKQENSLESRQRALDMWIWLTKALESRSHSNAGAFSLKVRDYIKTKLEKKN